MGTIEDIRKLLQDLVTPDLKAIRAEIAGDREAAKLRDDALAAHLDKMDYASKKRDEVLAAHLVTIDQASKMRDDALLGRLDAMEQASKMRDDALAASLNSKVELLLGRMDAQHLTVMNTLALDKRLSNLERQAKAAESATV